MPARELAEAFTPTTAEVKWAREKTQSDAHLLVLVVWLKSFQRLGYFPKRPVDLPSPQLGVDERSSAILLADLVQVWSRVQVLTIRVPSSRGSWAWMAEESGTKPYSSVPSSTTVPQKSQSSGAPWPGVPSCSPTLPVYTAPSRDTRPVTHLRQGHTTNHRTRPGGE